VGSYTQSPQGGGDMKHADETDVLVLVKRIADLEARMYAQRAVIEVLIEAQTEREQALLMEGVGIKLDRLATEAEHPDIADLSAYQRMSMGRAVEVLREWLPLPGWWGDSHGEPGAD